MPLKPIRFETLQDVSELLERLRKLELISFSADGTSIQVTPEQRLKLDKQFIVGNDFETYILEEALKANPKELYLSKLRFLTRNFHIPSQLSPETIEVIASDKLESSTTLICNKPLLDELLKLNPSDISLLKVRPKCKITGELVVFPILTTDSVPQTKEGIEAIKAIFDENNQGGTHGGYTLTARNFIPNYALLGLQMINLKNLPQVLAPLSDVEINEKIENLRANLTRVNKLIQAFRDQYPNANAISLSNRQAFKEESDLSAQIVKARSDHQNYRNEISKQTEDIKGRKSSVIWLAVFSELMFTIPILIYKSKHLYDRKKQLEVEKAKLNILATVLAPFLREQVDKVYATVITPTLEVISELERKLRPLPASEKIDSNIVPFQSSATPLLQHALLQPPSPPRSTNELAPDLNREAGFSCN